MKNISHSFLESPEDSVQPHPLNGRSAFPNERFAMDRYMPITGIDSTTASLLIDTEAPLDVLHENAATASAPRPNC
ncbi:hypothetical protein D3C85_1245280 [compost metagenome]